MKPHFLLAAAALAGFVNLSTAAPARDAGWFESGDLVLRLDLQLLNDAGVIRLPVSQWPLPRAAVAHALSSPREHLATNAAVKAALDRVRSRLSPSTRFAAGLTAGNAGLLRDFDTLGRDDIEGWARASYNSGRLSGALNVTVVGDPADDQSLRLDGSHLTASVGNWLVSANALDRWWGPAHESSLILSNNARPMPTLSLERATALPFESGWLSWLGPWRLNFSLSQMESERIDIDRPLFMALRVVVMPFRDIELGFSRTAQFCGRQQACTFSTFTDLLVGNDNVGIDTTAEEEPGNQMAGFDIRWNSPVGNLPYAIYSQFIGEDESSYLPAKYLGQFGLEVWHPLARGGIIQGFAEYSTTTCSELASRGPYYNCAFNQGQFDSEGYRYRGRVIGHTSDRDAESYALGATLTGIDGSIWSATARESRLNRDEAGDVRNTVAQVPTTYHALELGWRGSWMGQELSVDLGVQSLEPAGQSRETDAFGFIGWRYEFEP
jgi:hypothetical protein